jgi:hypothetical protein
VTRDWKKRSVEHGQLFKRIVLPDADDKGNLRRKNGGRRAGEKERRRRGAESREGGKRGSRRMIPHCRTRRTL